jgi:type II secretory ATPase GspE/PulE/Tfp pilus assembly ATPase PilB-like protein
MYASNSSHNLTNDLREKRISPQEAIAKVVNPDDRTVNFDLIDPEVNDRTVKLFVKNKLSFPVILLLLWRGCYYFGSATPLSLEDTQLLEYRLEAKVKIIHIHPNSYRQWIRQQNISAATASTSAIDTRLAILDEDICKIMRKQIANAPDQTSRIRAIFTCALRYRASDIHCEPTPEGLQVRFRIDGVLRSIICLSPDYSRQIVVALKVWADLDIAESRRPQDGRIGAALYGW